MRKNQKSASQEPNPGHMHGRLLCYSYTTGAPASPGHFLAPCISFVLVLTLCYPCCLCPTCVGLVLPVIQIVFPRLHVSQMLGRDRLAMQIMRWHVTLHIIKTIMIPQFCVKTKNTGAPARSRTPGTSMGSLYVTATLLALLHRLAFFSSST